MGSTAEDQRPTILVDTQLSSMISALKETQYKIIIENPKMNDLKKGKSKKNVRLGFREFTHAQRATVFYFLISNGFFSAEMTNTT